jgi:hypothetical protein
MGLTGPFLSFQERVVYFFIPNGCFWAMARVNHSFIRQYKQLVTDAGNKGIEIAARQVGTTYAFAEQNIAANNELLRLTIKTNMPR